MRRHGRGSVRKENPSWLGRGLHRQVSRVSSLRAQPPNQDSPSTISTRGSLITRLSNDWLNRMIYRFLFLRTLQFIVNEYTTIAASCQSRLRLSNFTIFAFALGDHPQTGGQVFQQDQLGTPALSRLTHALATTVPIGASRRNRAPPARHRQPWPTRGRSGRAPDSGQPATHYSTRSPSRRIGRINAHLYRLTF